MAKLTRRQRRARAHQNRVMAVRAIASQVPALRHVRLAHRTHVTRVFFYATIHGWALEFLHWDTSAYLRLYVPGAKVNGLGDHASDARQGDGLWSEDIAELFTTMLLAVQPTGQGRWVLLDGQGNVVLRAQAQDEQDATQAFQSQCGCSDMPWPTPTSWRVQIANPGNPLNPYAWVHSPGDTVRPTGEPLFLPTTDGEGDPTP